MIFFFVLNDWRLLVSWLIFMNRVQSLVKIWFQSHLFVLIWTLNQISIQSLWKLRINSLRYMIYHEFIVIETHVDCSFWLQLSCKIIALLVKNGYVARKCMIRLGTLVFSFQFELTWARCSSEPVWSPVFLHPSVCPYFHLSENFLYFHLLQNHWANFNQTWHKASYECVARNKQDLKTWRKT